MNRYTALAGLGIVAAASAAHADPTGGADDTALAATSAQPAITIPVVADGDRVFWKNDLRFTSGDGQTTYRIGGRIHYDGSWIGQDDAIQAAGFNEDDSWRFRRARLYVKGQLYGNIGFNAQYDFAGTDVADFTDVYMTIDNFLVGELRVGQMKEPFSLEWQTSSNDITFLERSLAYNLSPMRSVGFMLSDWNEENALGWAAGIFGSMPDTSVGDANVGRDGYAGTGRVTWAPTYDPDNDQIVHVGASVSIRGAGQVDFGGISYEISGFGGGAGAAIPLEDSTHLGVEAAGVFGPFSVQAEFNSATQNGTGSVDPDATGFYLQGSYFLTGESRPYTHGHFGRVTPESNWRGFGEDGTGAWELAARYSMLDVDNVAEASGLSAGVNWYLNPNARIMLNYVMQSIDDSNGGGGLDADADAISARFQVTF
ncbi:OprO/OprP family phosphate-selective porin [Engelhardtia mirabilis]|uniref:Porin P n=1 Tax=Engelhardtia mirabilis TaxID=2528011 RepID=A0A518BSH1_9BACT|nr:Porin P precursor [Planctomycetes bacterium Pla133]QDV04245.1 Porin P precursor [Planctomycetes bacterium Pla86]